MKKRIVAITLSLLTLLTMLSGCFEICFFFNLSNVKHKSKTVYLYDIEFSYNIEGKYATAWTTTKKGRAEKETVIIPEIIKTDDGDRIVYQVGTAGTFGFTICENFKSDVLKKVFIPASVSVMDIYFDGCPNLKCYVYDLNPDYPKAYEFLRNRIIEYTWYCAWYCDFLDGEKNDAGKIVLNNENIIKMVDEKIIITNDIPYCIYQLCSAERYIKSANVEYHLNYETEKELFWFDYSETGKVEKSYEPVYEPKREGYEFAGWYKEPECINEWNFETDSFADKTNPEIVTKDYRKSEIEELREEEKEKLFIETKDKVLERYKSLYTLKLYAKWNLI